MIKTFRRLRARVIGNKSISRYFLYAIGEIVLVVIGILIALHLPAREATAEQAGVNNWNENRKDKIQEIATLNKFLLDLKSDSLYYQVNLITIKVIDQLHKDLYLVAFKDKKDMTLENPAYIRRGLVYHPIVKENHPNISNMVSDAAIVEAIQAYYRIMNSVLESKTEHEDVVFQIRALLRQLRIHNTEAWFESNMLPKKNSEIMRKIVTSGSLISLSVNKDFQQLLFESSLKLNELEQDLKSLIEENSKLIAIITSYIQAND